MMETLPHEELTRITITLWVIWMTRRKLIHEDIHQSPLPTHLFITRFIAELTEVNNPSPSHVAATPRERSRRWLPPSMGQVKINVDADVSLYHNTGAASAICRDIDGTYLGSSILAIHGLVKPSTLEAFACRETLSLAEDLGMQHLHIASNCKEVVNHIHEGITSREAVLA